MHFCIAILGIYRSFREQPTMASLIRYRPILHLARGRAGLSTLFREPTVVGLKADPNPRETLKSRYQEILNAVAAFPEESAYRRNVTAITDYRLGVVDSHTSVEEIEQRLGLGQIEEVIEQADDELELIPHMAKWKPWATKPDTSPAKIEIID